MEFAVVKRQIYELHKTPALLFANSVELSTVWVLNRTELQRRGEGIVCAARKSGSTRSSDLHEWRNDLGTVSTRDSAKLQYE